LLDCLTPHISAPDLLARSPTFIYHFFSLFALLVIVSARRNKRLHHHHPLQFVRGRQTQSTDTTRYRTQRARVSVGSASSQNCASRRVFVLMIIYSFHLASHGHGAATRKRETFINQPPARLRPPSVSVTVSPDSDSEGSRRDIFKVCTLTQRESGGGECPGGRLYRSLKGAEAECIRSDNPKRPGCGSGRTAVSKY